MVQISFLFPVGIPDALNWVSPFFLLNPLSYLDQLTMNVLVVLVVQFPARGSTQMSLCPFPGVLWLWHFLYSVCPHPVSSLHIYTFVVSWALIVDAASQAGDVDSSRAPGLTSGLQGSVKVQRGALLLVPQFQCISSFVFYILVWFYLSWIWFGFFVL